jgi:hypothetical protein
MMSFVISDDHIGWAKRAARKHRIKTSEILEAIESQKGCCNISGVPLLFAAKWGMSQKGRGCHALYAAIDHENPLDKNSKFQIVCYDLNDLKGILPNSLFSALRSTSEWKKFISNWKDAGSKKPVDLKKLKQLLHEGKV